MVGSPICPRTLVRDPYRRKPSAEDDFGVEEGARDTGGDGEEVALAGEGFYLTGAGEFGKVDGTPGADAGGVGVVGSDAREIRQEFARVDEKHL